MKREDDHELWDLLGKAGEPVVSPFFARNVARAVRQQPSGGLERIVSWLRPKRLVPVAGLALVLTVATLSFHLPKTDSGSSDDLPETVARIDPQDYEVVADLDDLLASQDDNVWTENESLSL